MLSRAVSRRVIACCAVVLGLVTGCAGEDLTKANFERTTVKIEPGDGQGGEGQVPSGPIDDDAVSLSTLRGVDACGLLKDNIVGTFTPTGEARSNQWGSCARDYVDAGGKPVKLSLELGDSSVFADQATGSVEGLPLVETSIDETNCYSVAVTQREPDMGISVSAQHEQAGGAPCDSGYQALTTIVQELRQSPATLSPAGKRSLLTVDLCEAVDEKTLRTVFGEDEFTVRPGGLHACQFTQDDITVYVSGRVGYPISVTEGTEEIELADERPAVRQPGQTETAECDVRWNHLGISDTEAEVIYLNYYDYADDADSDTACKRVTKLAKGVVKGLP